MICERVSDSWLGVYYQHTHTVGNQIFVFLECSHCDWSTSTHASASPAWHYCELVDHVVDHHPQAQSFSRGIRDGGNHRVRRVVSEHGDYWWECSTCLTQEVDRVE